MNEHVLVLAQLSKATRGYGLHFLHKCPLSLVSCLGYVLGLLLIFPDVRIHHRL